MPTPMTKLLMALLLLALPGRALAQDASPASPEDPGRTEVAVLGEDDGATVLLDGREVGTLPLAQPLLVAPGPHRLRLTRGKRHVETQIQLLLNRPMQVRFTLVPPLAVATPTAAATFQVEAGDTPEALLQPLTRAASQAAAQERILLLPRESQSEAQYIITLKIVGRWQLGLTIYDIRAGAEAAAGQRACERCSAAAAGQLLAELLSRLAQEATTRPRGDLVVTVAPPQAAVTVDGQPLPVTAGVARREAFTGDHEVAATLDGYAPFQRTVTVADGETAQVPARLTRIPAPVVVAPLVVDRTAAPPPRSAPLYRKVWFWAAVGGAVLAGSALTAGLVAGLHKSSAPSYQNPFYLTF